jgi:hypothetical protein
VPDRAGGELGVRQREVFSIRLCLSGEAGIGGEPVRPRYGLRAAWRSSATRSRSQIVRKAVPSLGLVKPPGLHLRVIGLGFPIDAIDAQDDDRTSSELSLSDGM